MRESHIWIPLEILLILDQNILKIEPEMAELALIIDFVLKRSDLESWAQI